MLYLVRIKTNNRVLYKGMYDQLPVVQETEEALEISQQIYDQLGLEVDKFYYYDDEVTSINREYLELTTDAVDTDGDGIPDIVGDGQSTATITIKKYLGTGDLDTSFNGEVNVSVTRGRISSRKFNLVNGIGTVVLTSIAETTLTFITVVPTNTDILADDISIFFRP